MTRSHWMRFLLNSIVCLLPRTRENMCLQPLRSLLVVPGAHSSGNESHEIRVLIGQSRPTFATERTQNQSASSAQWDTFEEVVDTEDDGSDTIDPGDLQEYVRDELEVLATCMDNGENDAPDSKCGQFTVGNSTLETC